MTARGTRRIFARATVALAFAAIGALAVVVLIAINVGAIRFGGDGAIQPSSTVGPTTTPGLISMKPGTVQMAANADCAACHITSSGQVGTRPIPVIAHPVNGWTHCTACHTNDALVRTAPGHSGIHATDCLVCHRQASQPAPPRIHGGPNTGCLSCHGITAAMPHEMADRPDTECWICHRGSEATDEVPSPGP